MMWSLSLETSSAGELIREYLKSFLKTKEEEYFDPKAEQDKD